MARLKELERGLAPGRLAYPIRDMLSGPGASPRRPAPRTRPPSSRRDRPVPMHQAIYHQPPTRPAGSVEYQANSDPKAGSAQLRPTGVVRRKDNHRISLEDDFFPVARSEGASVARPVPEATGCREGRCIGTSSRHVRGTPPSRSVFPEYSSALSVFFCLFLWMDGYPMNIISRCSRSSGERGSEGESYLCQRRKYASAHLDTCGTGWCWKYVDILTQMEG